MSAPGRGGPKPPRRSPVYQVVEIHVVVDLGGGAVRRGVIAVKDPRIVTFERGDPRSVRRRVRLEVEGEVVELSDRYASGFIPPPD